MVEGSWRCKAPVAAAARAANGAWRLCNDDHVQVAIQATDGYCWHGSPCLGGVYADRRLYSTIRQEHHLCIMRLTNPHNILTPRQALLPFNGSRARQTRRTLIISLLIACTLRLKLCVRMILPPLRLRLLISLGLDASGHERGTVLVAIELEEVRFPEFDELGQLSARASVKVVSIRWISPPSAPRQRPPRTSRLRS